MASDTLSRNPLCIYEPHCGNQATLGPPEDDGDCINRDIICAKCGRCGVQSTNKTHAAPRRTATNDGE